MSVLQSWLEQIPIRMQSTLLLSLRGPDTHQCVEIKKIQRWMRGLVFKPGNPANVAEFMTSIENVPTLYEKGPLAKELEFCTQHFYSHLIHGLEVIAYRHPIPDTSFVAFQLFSGMCFLLHLLPEEKLDFEMRLKQIEWPDGQPESFEDVK